MFVLVAMTGIRAGELAGLSVDDLDFDRKLIYIRRSVWKRRIQTTKSKASKGVLPMPNECRFCEISRADCPERYEA